MEKLNLKTKVVHSESNTAWNVINTKIPGKFKIARIPYLVCDNSIIDTKEKSEALNIAEFISYCFNNSEKILNDNQ